MSITDSQNVFANLNAPSLPSVLEGLNELLQDPQVSIADIGRAVSADASIAARTIRIANSSYYALTEPAQDIERAAIVLGIRALRSIVTRASILQHYDYLARIEGFDVTALWKHSILTAQMAELVAQRLGATGAGVTPEDLYTCGLLHDIGKIVLLDNFGDEYVGLVRTASSSGRELHECEQARFGFDHARVGRAFAVKWSLPEVIQHMISDHHDRGCDLRNDPPLAVIMLADTMTNHVERGAVPTGGAIAAHRAARALGVSRGTAAELLELTLELHQTVEI